MPGQACWETDRSLLNCVSVKRLEAVISSDHKFIDSGDGDILNLQGTLPFFSNHFLYLLPNSQFPLIKKEIKKVSPLTLMGHSVSIESELFFPV